MMFYSQRQFVGMSEAYDHAEEGGFREVVSDTPLVPRVFAPTGALVYGKPITRMGVLSTYSMQKAIHHWFTADATIEVTECEWLEAMPPLAIHRGSNFGSYIVFETEDSIFVGIIALPTESDTLTESSVSYSMQFIDITAKDALLCDSMLVVGKQAITFNVMGALTTVPLTVMSQLVLDRFNLHGKRNLYQWTISESDQSGVIETLVTLCDPAKLAGYRSFLYAPAQPNKKLYS